MQEAVFSCSSAGFQIRAAQGRAVDHRVAKQGLAKPDLAKPRVAKHGFAGLAEHVAATLFFIFSADCRLCGSRLIQVSRLPVCHTCLLALRPLPGSYYAPRGVGFSLNRRREDWKPHRPDASSAAAVCEVPLE